MSYWIGLWFAVVTVLGISIAFAGTNCISTRVGNTVYTYCT